MLKIYHNPRCQKSREGLQLLESSRQDFEVIKYLENVPTQEELKEIIQSMEIAAIDLVRKKEKIWKERYQNLEMTDDEIIKAMVDNPKLIERPIVIKDKMAVIGRPLENIKAILR